MWLNKEIEESGGNVHETALLYFKDSRVFSFFCKFFIYRCINKYEMKVMINDNEIIDLDLK